MSDENNLDQVDQEKQVDINSIKAQLRAEIEAEYKPQLEKVLKNRDEILEEKRVLAEKYKGVDDKTIEELRAFEVQKNQDEMTRLIAEGKIEEATQKVMRSQIEDWNREREQYTDRIKSAQEERDSFAEQLEALHQKTIDMTKRSYLKDLVGSDDSFKKEYFGDFVDLYGKRADFDEETGTMFAKDENGKRMIDANGDYLKFEEYYKKQKVNHGLFWAAGSGSGVRGTGQPGGDGVKFSDMNWQQKNQLRKEMGDKKYAEFVRQQTKK